MIYSYINNKQVANTVKNIENNYPKERCLIFVDDRQEFIQKISGDDSFVIIKDTDMNLNKPVEELAIDPSKEIILDLPAQENSMLWTLAFLSKFSQENPIMAIASAKEESAFDLALLDKFMTINASTRKNQGFIQYVEDERYKYALEMSRILNTAERRIVLVDDKQSLMKQFAMDESIKIVDMDKELNSIKSRMGEVDIKPGQDMVIDLGSYPDNQVVASILFTKHPNNNIFIIVTDEEEKRIDAYLRTRCMDMDLREESNKNIK